MRTTSNNLVLLCGTFTGQFSRENSVQVGGFNPIETYYVVKMVIFPRDRGENKRYLKPPPRVKVASLPTGKVDWESQIMRIHNRKLPKILLSYQTDME